MAIIQFSIKAKLYYGKITVKKAKWKEVFSCMGILKSSMYHLCWPVHSTVQSQRLLSRGRDVDRLPAQSLASGGGHPLALVHMLHPSSLGLTPGVHF